MPGYILHLVHVNEIFNHLSDETKSKMPKDALRSFMIGAIVPDLAGKQKYLVHFYKDHPIYGEFYEIPDMDKVEAIFLKKHPTYLGVLAHLKYDMDHVNRFLLVYAKPSYDDNKYENTITGEKMSGLELLGNKKDVYGNLYKLYDKFNAEMAVKFTPELNEAFGTNFSADKEGFLSFMKWLFPERMPMSGIPEVDNYRTMDDIHGILKGFFDNDGKDCKLNADIDDLVKIVKESAVELAKQIDELYINEK